MATPIPVSGTGATAMEARSLASARWSASNSRAAASTGSPLAESVSSPATAPKPISQSPDSAEMAFSRSGLAGA